MDEIELEQLRRNPKWMLVLEQYHRIHAENREKSTDFDGWVSRLHEVPETHSDELPGIHGKLIAFGFLKYDLAGRDGGIRYQLTPLGKQGLHPTSEKDDEDSEDALDQTEVLAMR